MKEFPLGSPEFVEKRHELELPAVEVRNTVRHVNPAFKEVPFRIEEGKPTPLGLFFTPDEEKHDPESVRHMVIAPEWRSGRAGSLHPVIFRDTDGNLYRDVDVKGMGAFRRHTPDKGSFYVREPGPVEDHDVTYASTYGILDRRVAEYDEKRSEELIRAGIRTYRIIGNAELGEVIDKNGEKIPITEAKKRGLIPNFMEPALEFRAFGTRERIQYLKGNTERGRLAVEDAKRLVAAELGREPDNLSIEEYAEWFTKTLAQQIAKLKKYGLYHGYLHYHNLTLDCRIVDLDSVNELAEEAKRKNVSEEDLNSRDFDDARSNLMELWEYLGLEVESKNQLFDLYEKAYDEELKKKEYINKAFGFLRKKLATK